MEEAILLYKCNFMVTKTKNVLQTSGKFYACDTGIRNSECKWQIQNRGYLLENIIYLQLLRKGYKVFSGKM
jgi:predicted AAA+ superfamily ATPase